MAEQKERETPSSGAFVAAQAFCVEDQVDLIYCKAFHLHLKVSPVLLARHVCVVIIFANVKNHSSSTLAYSRGAVVIYVYWKQLERPDLCSG